MKPVRGLGAPTPGLLRFREAYPESRDWNDFRGRFESGEAYKELVGNLALMQRGLCAYCEIELTETDRQVEHFHPKSDLASSMNWTFEPGNLFAACKGGTNPHSSDDARRALRPSKRSRSCGEAKEGRALDGSDPTYPTILKPSDLPAFPSLFRVENDGCIGADREACGRAGIDVEEARATIIEFNLDCERLRIARRAVWDALLESLPEGGVDDAAYADSMRSLAEAFLLPDSDGRLRRFFSTMRCFFGEIGDITLRDRGIDWI